MKDEARKIKLYTRRAIVIAAVKVIFLSSTVLRFYFLQIVEGAKYKNLSHKNRIRVQPIVAERGLLLDRNGEVLACNQMTFNLVQNARLPLEENLEPLQQILAPLNPDFTDRVVVRNLVWEDLARISSHKAELKHFEIEKTTIRYYPYEDLVAHIVGYIGKNSTQIAPFADLKIGILGAERAYEGRLKGTIGRRELEVNANNQVVREISMIPSIKGEDVKTSIDLRLEQKARELLNNRQGSVIIQKIKTGELLCLHSSPSFNANKFIRGFSNTEWEELKANPNNPLLNKSIAALYPPGSTFKIVMALAILEADISPKKTVFCSGTYQVGNRIFKCRNTSHGTVNLEQAIQKSCNVYFYKMGEEIGINHIHNTAAKLGIIGHTGLELLGEGKSFVPSREWKKQRLKQPWLVGDTINTAIGQGFTLMTPIMLNVLIARVAGGKMVQPTLDFIAEEDAATPSFPALTFSTKHLEIVRHGLYLTTNEVDGTNYLQRLGNPNFALCGKTGTAQVVGRDSQKKIEDHSLFTGFAPYLDPQYAVTAVVEFGSWGSKAAAPLASAMMKYLHQII